MSGGATLCDACRRREAARAEAAAVLLSATTTADERRVALEELRAALALLALPPGEEVAP